MSHHADTDHGAFPRGDFHKKFLGPYRIRERLGLPSDEAQHGRTHDAVQLDRKQICALINKKCALNIRQLTRS